jgi:prepilin-type processing-associated H-X9-DG protein
MPVAEEHREAPPASIVDPLDRSIDRALAHAGLLDDAEPIFAAGEGVPRAGVLLAIPGLVRSGLVEIARAVYGERALAPAFYGLRTTLVALVLLALLRIKRPEELKEHAPPELGRLLGLDRAPEVKTLRRKLAQLASAGKAVEFGRELARRRVAERGRTLGFLYVDGHVRVYHGKHKIPKAHVPQMRLAVPGTTDYYPTFQRSRQRRRELPRGRRELDRARAARALSPPRGRGRR